MPFVAGWLSDRIGRKPLIVGVYLGGAIGFAVFLVSGSSVVGLWAGIVLMGLFSLAESPQLPGAPRRHRPTRDQGRDLRALLHARLRGRVAVGRDLRRDHRGRRQRDRAAVRVRPDGGDVRPSGRRDRADAGRAASARGVTRGAVERCHAVPGTETPRTSARGLARSLGWPANPGGMRRTLASGLNGSYSRVADLGRGRGVTDVPDECTTDEYTT